MQGITTETTLLLHKTNALAEDIQHKSEDLNTVVDAVKGVGGSIQRVNQTIDQITNRVQLAASQNDEKITQVVQWGNVCIELLNKWKKHKAEQKTTVYTSTEADKDITLSTQETRYQRSQS